ELRRRGFRIFRPAHYPSTPGELDAADELGLLVVEEINVSSLSGRVLGSKPVRDFAAAQLTAMIRRDRGHPSVIAWSIGNENRVDGPEGIAYVHDMVALGKSIDPTRLYTQVSALHDRDPTYQFQDLVSVNAYAGWYAGRAAGIAPLLVMIHRVARGKPILIAEYGAESDPHYPGDGKGSERYQSCLVDEYRRVLDGKPGLLGRMVWTMTDFWRDPQNAGGNPLSIQPFSSKGLLSYDRRPKLAWRTMFSPVRLADIGPVYVPRGADVLSSVGLVFTSATGRAAVVTVQVTAPPGFIASPSRLRVWVPAHGRRIVHVGLRGRLPSGRVVSTGLVRAIYDRETEAHPRDLVVVADGTQRGKPQACA
ncbi:MAG: hypothetical protein LC640_10230, partial [Frankia sp.]|nr:hypothetical protein [Frankia sp.]